MYQGREVCRRAAEIEPAIIFPDYIFGQINEARHVPGTIALGGQLTLRLLDSVCNEIARNGLTKVVVVNCHGGNIGLLSFFNMLQLDRQRDYVVYVVQPISAAFSCAGRDTVGAIDGFPRGGRRNEHDAGDAARPRRHVQGAHR